MHDSQLAHLSKSLIFPEVATFQNPACNCTTCMGQLDAAHILLVKAEVLVSGKRLKSQAQSKMSPFIPLHLQPEHLRLLLGSACLRSYFSVGSDPL